MLPHHVTRPWGGRSRALGGVLFLLLGAGCTHTVASLGVATPAGVTPARFERSGEGRPVEGRSCAIGVLFIPLGSISINAALQDAYAQAGGGVLTDVMVREKQWTTLLVSGGCYIVNATAWSITGSDNPAGSLPRP
jgi:hypothetical protein